ncbi:ABC-type transport auxiliary lipoprotein family protein [Sphingomonas sp.]|uniref:ABC-type transport auxiliary lipoprotein family protein n=1 Tax=Sphingomonas sp. TaxID=28214 RepID=UPI0017B8B146|nr:ABC-type transport auxiliary lipoprotein family protein [Sphingomonas sp.]MBA3511947.1 membrane integrity-associated transporter subunit PqiC [Sphingomonas sp.]
MKPLLRTAVAAVLGLALSACSLGGLLGGGKTPPTLLTLTPQAALQGEFTRTVGAGQAVTIAVPVIGKELRTVRVPAQVSHMEVAYIEDLQWVDTPDRLFQSLLAETVRRTTGRVVLDPRQATLDPGVQVAGELHKMGYDAAEQAVIVRFDGAISTAGGTRVETRRFEARVPTTPDAANVGYALNQAANQVALEAASWIAR